MDEAFEVTEIYPRDVAWSDVAWSLGSVSVLSIPPQMPIPLILSLTLPQVWLHGVNRVPQQDRPALTPLEHGWPVKDVAAQDVLLGGRLDQVNDVIAPAAKDLKQAAFALTLGVGATCWLLVEAIPLRRVERGRVNKGQFGAGLKFLTSWG